MAPMNQVLSPRTVRLAAAFTSLFALCVIGALMLGPERQAMVWLLVAGAAAANFATMFLIGREVLAGARPDAPAESNTRLAALAAGSGAVAIGAVMAMLL